MAIEERDDLLGDLDLDVSEEPDYSRNLRELDLSVSPSPAADRLREEAAIRKRQTIEGFFDHPEAIVENAPSEAAKADLREALKAYPDAKTAQMEWAVTDFLGDVYGMEGEELLQMRPVLQKDWEERTLGEYRELPAETLYGAISSHIGEERKKREWINGFVGKAQKRAMLEGGSWMEAFDEDMQAGAEEEGFDPEMRDRYAAAYRETFEAMTGELATYREDAQAVYKALSASFGTEKGDEFEAEGDAPGIMEIIEQLDARGAGREDRMKLYALVGAFAEADGEDYKNFFKRTGETFARGASKVFKSHPRMGMEAATQAIIRAEREGSPLMVVDTGEGPIYASGSGGLALFAGLVPRQATEQEVEMLAEDARRLQRFADIERELTAIGEGTIDPVGSAGGALGVAERWVWQPVVGNLPFMAQALLPSPFSLPLTYSTIQDMRFEEALARDPDMDREQALSLMSLSAAAETGVEMVSARMIFNKAPSLTRLLAPLKGSGSAGARFAQAFGLKWGEQFSQEMAQDAMPIVIQQISQAMSEDDPSTDWGEVWKDYGIKSWETLWAVSGMSLVGAGLTTWRDVETGEQYLNDLTALKVMGISDSNAQRILDEKDFSKKEALYMEAFAERDQALSVEMVDRMEAERQEAEYYNESPLAPTVVRRGDGFEVIAPMGEKVLGRVNSQAAAIELARDWQRNESERISSEVLDVVDWINDRLEEGSSMEVVDKSRSQQDLIDEGLLSSDQAYEAIRLAGMNLGIDLDDATPSQMRVFGVNLASYKQNVFSDVSRIYRGANVFTPFEEKAEGYLKRAFAEGELSDGDVAQWKRNVEERTGRRTHGDELGALVEWFSSQAVAYLAGRSKEFDADQSIPSAIRKFLRRLSQYARQVLGQAAALMKLRREGRLGDDFEAHLKRSVGVDEQYLMDLHSGRREMAIREETLRDPENELKEVLKRVGGIPAISSESVYAGELRAIQENFGKGQSLRFFRKSAGTLENLIERLNVEGFSITTIPEVLDLLDQTSRGIDVFPDLADMGGEAVSFSLSMEEQLEKGIPTRKGILDSLPESSQEKAREQMRQRGEIPMIIRRPDGERETVTFTGWQDLRGHGYGVLATYARYAPAIAEEASPGHTVTPLRGGYDIVAAESPLPPIPPQAPSFSMERSAALKKRLGAENVERLIKENPAAELQSRSMEEVEALIMRGITARDDAIRRIATYADAVEAGPRMVRTYRETPRMETPEEFEARLISSTGIEDAGEIEGLVANIEAFNRGESWPGWGITLSMTPIDSLLNRKLRERRITERVSTMDHKGEKFDPRVRWKVEQVMYEVLPNKVTRERALKQLDQGIEESVRAFRDPSSGLHPATRHAVGMALMEYFNQTGQMEQAISMTEELAERGTEAGQGVQIFTMLGRVLDTPSKAQLLYARERRRAEEMVFGKQETIEAIDVASKVFEEANKLFNGWIARVLKPRNAGGHATESEIKRLPEITFALDPRLAGLVVPARRLLEKYGGEELDRVLLEKYGEKIKPHLAELKIEALLGRSAAAKRRRKPGKRKAREAEGEFDEAQAVERERSMFPVEMEITDEMWQEIERLGIASRRQIETGVEGAPARMLTDEQWSALMDAGILTADQLDLEGFESKLLKSGLSRLKERNISTSRQLGGALESVFKLWDRGELTGEDLRTAFGERLKIPKASEATMAKIADMAERIGRLPAGSAARRNATADLVNTIHDDIAKNDWIDVGWSIWYANILSGYNTDIRNFTDTGMQVLMDIGMSALAVDPIGSMRQLWEGYQGAVEGSRLGAREGARHLRTGEELVGKEVASKFGGRSLLERVSFKGGKGNPFNYLKFVGRALVAEDSFWFHTALEAKARQVAWEIAGNESIPRAQREKRVEELLGRSASQTSDHQAMAAREWEDLLPGDTADTREKWIKRRTAELRMQSWRGEMLERATDFAARATYNYKPEGVLGVLAESVGVALAGLRNADVFESFAPAERALKAVSSMGTVLMPFVRIVANVSNRWLDYTPVGMARAAFDGTIELAAGKVVRKEKTRDNRLMELKKGLFGTAAIAILLARDPEDEEGPLSWFKIHGDGPTGWSAKNQLRETGWMPNSWQIGDVYVSWVNTPLAGIMSWVGKIHDTKRYDKKKLEEEDFRVRMAYSALGAFQAMRDKSFLASISDMFEILGRDEQSAARGLQRFVGRTLSPTSAVPFSNLLKQANRDFDPFMRDREGMMAELMSVVPVVSRLDRPALNRLGEPIENRPFGWIWNVEDEGGDDSARIWRLMAKANAYLPDNYYYKSRMEPEMFYEFEKLSGQYVKEQMADNLDLLEQLPEEPLQGWMGRAWTRASRRARREVGYVADE